MRKFSAGFDIAFGPLVAHPRHLVRSALVPPLRATADIRTD